MPLREQRRIVSCIKKYGADFTKEVCLSFPSKGKEEVYPTIESAIRGDAPTLPFLDRVYGEGSSVFWLGVQIMECLLFLGLRDKMSPYQRDALAKSLYDLGRKDCVTMAEWMQFFSRFEQGYYKQFMGYERPNPQVITQSFIEFFADLQREREKVREQMRKEEEQRQHEEWAKNAVPMPESCKKHLDEVFKHISATQDKHIPKDNRKDSYYMVRHNGITTKSMPYAEMVEYIKTLEGEEYELLKG